MTRVTYGKILQWTYSYTTRFIFSGTVSVRPCIDKWFAFECDDSAFCCNSDTTYSVRKVVGDSMRTSTVASLAKKVVSGLCKHDVTLTSTQCVSTSSVLEVCAH